MEHWHTSTSAPYSVPASKLSSSRILTASTGNIQSYALDSNEGIENQNPYLPGAPSIKHELRAQSQFPIPKFQLGSNDQHADNLARLHVRRQHGFARRRRTDPERPYLQHPKYLQYRARPRCDAGADGKPVWDDRIEDAFQNALVNIEPMGKCKKSQRGRPYGRNELIAEWILQETGEERTRKQVSSHIQVLNTLLKGIPEWDALTTPDKTSVSERPSHQYYRDSIAERVRIQKSGASRTHYGSSSHDVPSRSYDLPSAGGSADGHNLMGLSFEMWVSLPGQMDQALHTYTRLQSSGTTLAPMPLEDFKNWRSSFPSLRPIVENWSTPEHCDIILLEANFKLMSDFPPKLSKLGISLELDFLHPSNNNHGSLANLMSWTCVTHMFQNGRLEKRLSHENCHPSGVGKVKPLFESRWWASTFTHLTERKKIAEDSKSDAALDLVNETSRNFFRGLTVMQEISADSMKSGMSEGIYTDPIPRRRRMAVLLWKFSQAPVNYIGTTTWRKLVPPPDRLATNSPTPIIDVSLPPLAMDSMIDSGHDDNLFGSNHNFMTDSGQQYSMFDTPMDEELCQDAFMNYRPETLSGFDPMHPTFDMPVSHNTLDHNLGVTFEMPSHGLPHLQDHTAPPTNNFFELPSQNEEGSQPTSLHPQQQRHKSFQDEDSSQNHHPLANFDMNTHQRLQVQLSATEQHHSPGLALLATTPSLPMNTTHPAAVDAEDEALRGALLAASAMSNVNSQRPQPQQPSTVPCLQPTSSSQPTYVPSNNPFTSPPIARPPLQTHHSFAGIGADGLHSRQSSGEDFQQTLANLQAYTENHDLHFGFDPHNHGHSNSNNSVNESGNHPDGLAHDAVTVSRPHSQPTLPATMAGELNIYNEMHTLNGGALESHANDVFETVMGEQQQQQQYQRQSSPIHTRDNIQQQGQDQNPRSADQGSDGMEMGTGMEPRGALGGSFVDVIHDDVEEL